MYVFTGESTDDLQATSDPPNNLVAVRRTIPHPAFLGGKPPTTLGVVNDVMLLELSETAATKPLALPRPENASVALTPGQPLMIAGFGRHTLSNRTIGRLHRGTVQLVTVASHELAAQPNPSAVCTGDSGGPWLIQDSPSSLDSKVVGITSRSDSSCAGPMIATRIDPYVNWIARHVDLDPSANQGCSVPGAANALTWFCILLIWICRPKRREKSILSFLYCLCNY